MRTPAHGITDQSQLTTPPVDRNHSRVDAPSFGASGREWKLPFSMAWVGNPHRVSFSGPNEYTVALATSIFIQAHAPTLFKEWKAAVIQAFSTSHQRSYQPRGVRALLELYEIQEQDPGPPEQLRTSVPRPTSVETPDITSTHWYYQRHCNVGNYIAHSRDPLRDSQIEVTQDIASLKFYLSQYDALAKSYSGEALLMATTWAQFRAPYFSCMQLCLTDLDLPAHFMSLINHGIGIHLATGQIFSSWQPRNLALEDKELLTTTQAVFEALARLYVEDFPQS
jgi:hypothetical protein